MTLDQNQSGVALTLATALQISPLNRHFYRAGQPRIVHLSTRAVHTSVRGVQVERWRGAGEQWRRAAERSCRAYQHTRRALERPRRAHQHRVVHTSICAP